MRTFELTISLALAGCFQSYDDGRERVPDPVVDVPGADIVGSTQTCELVTGDLLVVSDADIDAVPDLSCWDLAGTLALRGANITSLANVKHLRSVTGLVIADTALVMLDPHRTIEVLSTMRASRTWATSRTCGS